MSHLLTNSIISKSLDKLKKEQNIDIENKLIEELCKIFLERYKAEKDYLYCLFNDFFKYVKNLYKLGECENLKYRMASYITPYPDPCIIKCKTIQLRNKSVAKTVLFEKLKIYKYINNREFFVCDLSIIKKSFEEIEEMFDNKTDKQTMMDIFIEPQLLRIKKIIYNDDIKFSKKDIKNNIICKEKIIMEKHIKNTGKLMKLQKNF